MVIWSDYLIEVSDAMGVTAIQAGIMLSLIFTVGILLTILIATRGEKPQVTIPFGSLLMMVLFTFMGWLPIWLGSVLALVISIFIAYVFSRW